jgi:aflatoxin B1 aldehyde reductase
LLERAGEPHSISLAEISIRWLFHHSQLRMGGQSENGRDGILIGISSFDHLQKNLKFLENGPLPQEIVQAAEDSWHLVKVNCPNYWHGELSCYS